MISLLIGYKLTPVSYDLENGLSVFTPKTIGELYEGRLFCKL